MSEKVYSIEEIKRILEEIFSKNIDGFEKAEIEEDSKIDKEIKRTGVVVYEK